MVAHDSSGKNNVPQAHFEAARMQHEQAQLQLKVPSLKQ